MNEKFHLKLEDNAKKNHSFLYLSNEKKMKPKENSFFPLVHNKNETYVKIYFLLYSICMNQMRKERTGNFCFD